MRYYRFDYSTDKKKIGAGSIPQAEGIYDLSIDDKGYLFNAFNCYQKIVKDVRIPAARLRTKSAKLTDILSCSSYGLSCYLLISDRLKTLLESSKNIGFQFLGTTVSDFPHQNDYRYWFMNAYVFFPEYINYGASEISVSSIDGKSKEQVIMNSYEEFCEQQQLSAPRDLQIVRPVLLNEKIEYDLFALDRMPGVVWYIMSERLKQLVELAGCTGIDYFEL